MSRIIEDALTGKLAAWMADHRPAAIPNTVPILVANRDELRTRPCIVLATAEAKNVPGMPDTARVRLTVHVFTQIDDTAATAAADLAAEVKVLLADVAHIRGDLNSTSFVLHALLPRETATTPDEARGRESILTYEAVVSAV
jgi:hypothetical protein